MDAYTLIVTTEAVWPPQEVGYGPPGWPVAGPLQAAQRLHQPELWMPSWPSWGLLSRVTRVYRL
jgi:hypothetical protein